MVLTDRERSSSDRRGRLKCCTHNYRWMFYVLKFFNSFYFFGINEIFQVKQIFYLSENSILLFFKGSLLNHTISILKELKRPWKEIAETKNVRWTSKRILIASAFIFLKIKWKLKLQRAWICTYTKSAMFYGLQLFNVFKLMNLVFDRKVTSYLSKNMLKRAKMSDV